MADINENAPVQEAPVQPQQPQQPYQGATNVYVNQQQIRKGNGIGTAGFVLALLGLILCWIPVLNWILWLLGVIFSFIGVFRAPRGLAIAGLVISFIGIIIMITILGALFAAL